MTVDTALGHLADAGVTPDKIRALLSQIEDAADAKTRRSRLVAWSRDVAGAIGSSVTAETLIALATPLLQ